MSVVSCKDVWPKIVTIYRLFARVLGFKILAYDNPRGGGGGVLSYMGYIGMCGPKG